MIIKIKGIEGSIFTIAAQDIIKTYVKICFWLSWLIPFGALYVYDLIKGI